MFITIALSKDMVGVFFFHLFKFKYCWLSLPTLKAAHFTWHIALFVVPTLCVLALAAGGASRIWISGNTVCVGHIRMSLWAICSAVICLILSVWDVRTDFHIVSWMGQIQIVRAEMGGLKKKNKKQLGLEPKQLCQNIHWRGNAISCKHSHLPSHVLSVTDIITTA